MSVHLPQIHVRSALGKVFQKRYDLSARSTPTGLEVDNHNLIGYQLAADVYPLTVPIDFFQFSDSIYTVELSITSEQSFFYRHRWNVAGCAFDGVDLKRSVFTPANLLPQAFHGSGCPTASGAG